MNNNLKVSGLNFDISWKDKSENFRRVEKSLENVQSDLFILPEMFSTGFYMKPEEIADRNHETLDWMKSFAKKTETVICGSVSVLKDNNFYNRFYFVLPDCTYYQYDKRHLFSFTGEDEKFSAGNERIIVEYKGWRILLQVCYDLRFPVFSRNNDDYDAILYVANWPEKRIDAWNTLLKARAIENQAYVFGLNRIGIDGNNLNYPESSYCFFADGSIISEIKDDIVSAEFNFEKLKEFRKTFQFLNDRDSFDIK
ncbi:amidohydrolase [Kaistella jeonii]|uniref:Omega-amidase YafV n=1 Tax=Kaistella jeonii TaxID=266749 RepID=A0A0C1FBQ6_9FLAO|nr:amidohydrolase [Kaistella jeonii]KIA89313.1 amidohydrolase [Kaistella jeonii]SFC02602.1 Predicted amidohydrolase [Kaistella jeonii]VEI96631.1 (R)-stereoselective amidase [Kaistella jeonii]